MQVLLVGASEGYIKFSRGSHAAAGLMLDKTDLTIDQTVDLTVWPTVGLHKHSPTWSFF